MKRFTAEPAFFPTPAASSAYPEDYPVTLAPTKEAPTSNLALDLVRVTEAAALASARWLG